MTTEPRSGLSNPIRLLRNTDLPVPDGPSKTLISPAGRVSVTSDQMREGPNDFVSPSTTTSTPALIHPPTCRSERLRVRDLPATGDPLRGDREPAGGEQWLVPTGLVRLLVKEHHHDRLVPFEHLHGKGGHGRDPPRLLSGSLVAPPGELLTKVLDEPASDNFVRGFLVG